MCTTHGTATAGADFTGTSGALNFAAGVTSQTIVVPILDDAIFENSEGFGVTLSGAVNATIADATGAGTILDDGTGAGGTDNDTATLSVSNVTVLEGTDFHAVFVVGISNASTTPVSFSLGLADGSATGGGTDYGAVLEVSTDGGATWNASATATIAAGATSVLVRTPIANDALSEGSENFTLTATRTAGVTTNGSAFGTATIADDDVPPSVSINDVTVNEGAGTMTFTVTLNAPAGQPVSVNFATANATATAGADYTATSGTLSFSPGVLSQTVTVLIANDTIFENSETFSVVLSAAVNAAIADATGVGAILDNGGGAGGTDNDTPALSVSNVTVTEGTDTHAVFAVSLSNASTAPVAVNLALANGSATAADFGPGLEVSTDGGTTWAAASSVTFAPSVTSILVRTPIVNDALNEVAETFTLTATRTVGSTTNASAVGTATINDNDLAPLLTIYDVTVNEGGGTATFTVALNTPSGQAVSVSYATGSFTAISGADFTGTSGTLSFAPGVVSQTIVVAITNDTVFEASESFDVILSGAVNAGVSDGTGEGTILDDGTGPGGTDNDTPSLNVTNVTVTEGADAFAVFAVNLSNASTAPVTVNLALANGSATGADFGPGLEVSTDGGTSWSAATSVIFLPSVTAVLVRTPIANDAVDEPAETFTLTATRTAGATTNASATGTAAINDDDSAAALAIGDVTVNEAAGTMTFTVTLSAPSGQFVSVNYATSNGTAVAGADYTTASGVLNFAPGVTSQTLTVSIANDTIFENSESFDVILSGAVNATIADATGVGTILDDGTGAGGTDNDSPSLSVASVTVTEGTDAHAVFAVNLSNPSTTAVSVSLALADGSATGADYGSGLEISTDGGATWTSGTNATIAAGATGVLVRTPIVNDVLDEAAEGFTLTATRTAGVTTNASATGIATIIDDDPSPAFSIDDVIVNEGVGTATFTVTLSAPSGQTASVNYVLSNGTATAGSDFGAGSGVLNFAPGVTSQIITVPIVNDALFERSENFTVNLSGAVNATIADGTGAGTIRDDGTGLGGTDNDTPTVTVSNVTGIEGTDTHAVFSVGLSNASSTPITVNLALTAGTAGGADFGPGLEVSSDGGTTWSAAGSATLAAGRTSVLVRTPIIDDALDEPVETFTLTATVAAGTTVNPSASAIGTINDNDPPPAISINDVIVNEAAGTATFTVTLSGASSLPVSVNFATGDATATTGGDYTGTSGAVNFAAGVTGQTITVPILDDSIFETTEAFNVNLSGAVNATIADALGVGTIRDDDGPPTLSINDATVNEGAGTATFTVTLDKAGALPISVGYATGDGSARSGSDYVATGGTLNFASSVTSQTITVSIVNDARYENREAFTVLLSSPVNATIVDGSGAGTIVDDDLPQALKSIVSTSDSGTSGANVVVGEVVTFQLQFELAEGANAVVVLRDLLPAGLRFLPNDPVAISYTNVATSIGGLAAGTFTNATNDALISASLTVDDDTFTDGADVFFKLGTLVNTDTDADREFVTVSFSALVTNTALNQSGIQHAGSFAALVDLNGDGVAGYVSVDRDGDNAATGTESASDPANDGSGTSGVSNTVTTTVAEPILTLDKQITSAPAAIKAGGTLTYTITINHSAGSNGTAWDAILNDTMPAGLTITRVVGTSAAGGASVQTPVAIANGGGGLGGVFDIPVGGNVTVIYEVKVSDNVALGSSLNNLADITWSTLDGVNANERASGDGLLNAGGLNDYELQRSVTAIVVGADLSVTKDDGALSVSPGGRLTYTIRVTNNGTATATNVIVTDALPAGLANFNGVLSTPGATPGKNAVTYTVPSLAAGQTATFNVVVDLKPTAPAGIETFRNVVNVTSDDIDPTPADNTASDRDALIAAPDYTISKTDNRNEARPGDTLVYAITVRNTGDQGGTGIVVRDVFATGVFSSVIASDGGAVDLAAGTVTWNVASLAAGETRTLTLTARVQSSFGDFDAKAGNHLIRDTVIVLDDARNGADPTPADNTATDSDDLVAMPELRITNTDGVVTATPGQLVTYRVVAKNGGHQNSHGTVVIDSLPPGVILVSVKSGNPGMSGEPVIVGNQIIWTFQRALAVGEEVAFEIVARVSDSVPDGAILTNLASISDDGRYGADAISVADNASMDLDAVWAPPPVEPFRYAYDVFHDFGNDERDLRKCLLFPEAPRTFERAPLLPLMPIYSGEADPGATLVVSVFNVRGEPIGSQTVVVDAGGNWMATLPSSTLHDFPSHVQITEIPAPYSIPDGAGHNLRTYFSPAINPGHFFTETQSSDMLSGRSAPLLSGLGLENPLQLGSVKYGGELLSTQSTASGY